MFTPRSSRSRNAPSTTVPTSPSSSQPIPPPPLISPPAPLPPVPVNVVLLGDENIGKRPILQAIGGYRHVTTQRITEGPIFFRRHSVKRMDEFHGIRVSIGSTSSASASRFASRYPISIPPYMEDLIDISDTSNVRNADNARSSKSGTGESEGGRDIRVDLSVRPIDERIMGFNYNGSNHVYFQTVFKDAQVIVLCYRIGKPSTLRNIMDKWLPIVAYFAHDLRLPIVLIGIHPREPPKPFRLRRLPQRSLSLSFPTSHATSTRTAVSIHPRSSSPQSRHPIYAYSGTTTTSSSPPNWIPTTAPRPLSRPPLIRHSNDDYLVTPNLAAPQISQTPATTSDGRLGRRSIHYSVTLTPRPNAIPVHPNTGSKTLPEYSTISEIAEERHSPPQSPSDLLNSSDPSNPSSSSNQSNLQTLPSSSMTPAQQAPEISETLESNEPPMKTEEEKEQEEIISISKRLNAICSLQCRASDSQSVRNAFRSVGWIGYHYDLKSRSFRPPPCPVTVSLLDSVVTDHDTVPDERGSESACKSKSTARKRLSNISSLLRV